MATKLTREQKRKATYQKLRSMGFSASYARANRNNFALVSPNKKTRSKSLKKFRNARKSQLNTIVREYYETELRYPKKLANKYKSRRTLVWKDTLEYLRIHEIRLENEPWNMPAIPEELYKNGVTLFFNNYKYLNPKEDLNTLRDQLENGVIDSKTGELKKLTLEDLVRHNYRLHRFIVTQTDNTVKKFVETLEQQSDLDDYYTKMDASYKAPSKM